MNLPVPPSGRYTRLQGRGQHLTTAPPPLPPGLAARSAAVLREIVEQYVATGEPVGSRTLARRLPMALSPATIRNVMADLTEAGLLFAPHTSARRRSANRPPPPSPPPAAAWKIRWPRRRPCSPASPPQPASCWRPNLKAP